MGSLRLCVLRMPDLLSPEFISFLSMHTRLSAHISKRCAYVHESLTEPAKSYRLAIYMAGAALRDER
jgi:hypothetical protein